MKFINLVFLSASVLFNNFVMSAEGNNTEEVDSDVIIELSAEHVYVYMHVELNTSYFDDLEKRKADILQKATGYTPKKRKYSALESPVKLKAIKRVTLTNLCNEEKECRVIYIESKDFHEGRWAFVDPLFPKSSVAFDADSGVWSPLVDIYFKNHYKKEIKDELIFISSLIGYVNSIVDINHDTISTLIYFDVKDREDIVCRHLATLALPLVSKILLHKDCIYKGTVHQIAGGNLNNNYKDLAGHAWNFIRLGTDLWHVDFYHKKFANVLAASFLTSVIVHRCDLHDDDVVINSHELKSGTLEHDLLRALKERIVKSRKTVYACPEAYNGLATKRALNFGNLDEVNKIFLENEADNFLSDK